MAHVKFQSIQAGFTLIELMIVVGMIGILVSIASPQYNKYQRKSRQSEAKIALSSIYSLEKGFYGEYDAYAPGLDAIGYSTEGNRRFYVSTMCWTHTGANWAGTVTGYSGSFAVQYIDFLNNPFGGGGAIAAGCTTVYPSISMGTCAAQYPTNNPQYFVATAKGQLCAGCARDVWHINESKRLVNCSNGLD